MRRIAVCCSPPQIDQGTGEGPVFWRLMPPSLSAVPARAGVSKDRKALSFAPPWPTEFLAPYVIRALYLATRSGFSSYGCEWRHSCRST